MGELWEEAGDTAGAGSTEPQLRQPVKLGHIHEAHPRQGKPWDSSEESVRHHPGVGRSEEEEGEEEGQLWVLPWGDQGRA